MASVAASAEATAYKVKLDAAQPAIQAGISKMQVAQSNLPADLKPIAANCITQTQNAVPAMAAYGDAAGAHDEAGAQAALTQIHTVVTAFDTQCIKPQQESRWRYLVNPAPRKHVTSDIGHFLSCRRAGMME